MSFDDTESQEYRTKRHKLSPTRHGPSPAIAGRRSRSSRRSAERQTEEDRSDTEAMDVDSDAASTLEEFHRSEPPRGSSETRAWIDANREERLREDAPALRAADEALLTIDDRLYLERIKGTTPPIHWRG